MAGLLAGEDILDDADDLGRYVEKRLWAALRAPPYLKPHQLGDNLQQVPGRSPACRQF